MAALSNLLNIWGVCDGHEPARVSLDLSMECEVVDIVLAFIREFKLYGIVASDLKIFAPGADPATGEPLDQGDPVTRDPPFTNTKRRGPLFVLILNAGAGPSAVPGTCRCQTDLLRQALLTA